MTDLAESQKSRTLHLLNSQCRTTGSEHGSCVEVWLLGDIPNPKTVHNLPGHVEGKWMEPFYKTENLHQLQENSSSVRDEMFVTSTPLPASSLESPESQMPSHIWRQSMWHDKHLHCYRHPDPTDSEVKINKSLRNESFQNSYISADITHLYIWRSKWREVPSDLLSMILHLQRTFCTKKTIVFLLHFNRPRLQNPIESLSQINQNLVTVQIK